MAGTDVRQAAGHRIVDAEPQGDKPVAGSMPADLQVQTSDQVGGLEPLVHERAQDGQEQGHQQSRRTALAGDVSHRHHHASIVERQDVVDVAADGVRRAAEAERFDAGRFVEPFRQHRLLDVARDFEVVLERQAIGDLEQHQQIHQRERDEERPGALAEQRTGNAELDPERQRRADSDKADAAEEVGHADEREDQRDGVHHAPRRRQLQRERKEQQPRVLEQPQVPGEIGKRLGIGAAGEELVRLARLPREEPLQIVGGQILRKDIEECPRT